MDVEARRAIQRLSGELQRTQSELRAALRGQRRPQLGHSSIDSGTLDVVDEEGVPRLRLGWQPDGSVGIVAEGGDPPSAPTVPTVVPSIAGLRVSWDGQLADSSALPADFDRVDVHVSTTDGFVPSAATLVGSIRRAGEAGMLPVVPLPYQEHYVRLVGVTTGGVQGAASAQAVGTPTQVAGPDLVANSVTAGHIQAGSVTADKLEAVLALVTQIVGGTLSGARVEMDQDGLRGYNGANELLFAVDTATGSAFFSGDITGAEITGSSLLVGDPEDEYIRVGDRPYGGYEVRASGGGALVQMTASLDAAQMQLTPPLASDGEHFFSGYQYAFVAEGAGFAYPAVAYSSPYTSAVLPAGARAEIQLEGGSATVGTSRIRHSGDVHQFSMGVRGDFSRGVVEVDPALSIRAPAHAPLAVHLLAQPVGSGNNGAWTDFGEAEFERLTWRTGYSGRTDFRITMCGINTITAGATLSLGFRLVSGGVEVVPPALTRAAMVRARAYPGGSLNTYGEQQQVVVPLQLATNTEYTLIPCWRASGAAAVWGTGAADQLKLDMNYENSVTVTNAL